VTYAVAQDAEMPSLLGLLHGKYATPHWAVGVMVVVSAIIGMVGTLSVVALTGITLASNFGTFVLYAITCFIAFNAFVGRKEFNLFKHGIVPVVGLLANVLMLVTIFAMGFAGGGDAQTESMVALGFAGVWGIVSIVYVLGRRAPQRALVPRTGTQ